MENWENNVQFQLFEPTEATDGTLDFGPKFGQNRQGIDASSLLLFNSCKLGVMWVHISLGDHVVLL